MKKWNSNMPTIERQIDALGGADAVVRVESHLPAIELSVKTITEVDGFLQLL